MPTRFFHRSLRRLALRTVSSLLLISAASGSEPSELFDGQTLKGWEGNERYWRVENGAITGEIKDGEAPTTMRPTAAAPTAIRRLRSEVEELLPLDVEVVVDVVAPPELAAMTAVPLALPARKVTVARPLASVLASAGSIVPSVVVNVTRVPLWGGVPADSSTCAVIVAVPLIGSAVVADVSVMDEPVGARNGVFSQAANSTLTASTRTAGNDERVERGIMSLNILSAMDLAGQERFARDVALRRDQRGYAMAALLVSLAIASVMLTVAMPTWKQLSQREKEEELIFRGQQYARAIGLFQRRAGPGALPPNLDVLVQQRFLRKKYKDPITNDDFQPLLAGQQVPGQAQNNAQAGGRGGVQSPSTPVAVGAAPGQAPGSTCSPAPGPPASQHRQAASTGPNPTMCSNGLTFSCTFCCSVRRFAVSVTVLYGSAIGMSSGMSTIYLVSNWFVIGRRRSWKGRLGPCERLTGAITPPSCMQFFGGHPPEAEARASDILRSRHLPKIDARSGSQRARSGTGATRSRRSAATRRAWRGPTPLTE